MAVSPPNLDLAKLVGEHHEVLYRYAYRLTGSVPDAEDLTQQTFLLAQQKLGQVREAENVRGWLFAILRNCYLKGFRKRAPVPAASVDLDIESIPAEVIDRPIDSEDLQHALDELSAEFKLVVVLFYFEQRSYREMAEMLDVPLGTVMSRLSRAKACLRRRLFEPPDPPSAEPAARNLNSQMIISQTISPQAKSPQAGPAADSSAAADGSHGKASPAAGCSIAFLPNRTETEV